MSTCTLVAGRARGTRAKRDRFLHRRRESAAGDFAFAGAGDDDLLVAAQHAAIFEQQRRRTSSAGPRPSALERLAADEIARRGLERHGPGEAGLERVLALVHVVAVEIHGGFESQRVARAEAGGFDAAAR